MEGVWPVKEDMWLVEGVWPVGGVSTKVLLEGLAPLGGSEALSSSLL